MPKRVEEYEKDPAYSAFKKEVGLRIRAIRKLAKWTQTKEIEELKVGASQSAWSKWEQGTRMPDAFVMTRFAMRHKASLDLIYRGIPTNSHEGLVALLRLSEPDLVVRDPTDKAPDKDTILASYMAAISQT